jgi:hypothetical protein
MGKTYTQSKRFDDEVSGQRSGKHSKHANGKKTGGMKTLNSYVEEDYEDPFEDDLEIHDEVFIQHTKS